MFDSVAKLVQELGGPGLVATLALGLAAVVVPVLVHLAERRRKTLIIEVLEGRSLLNSSESAVSQIQVLHDGKKVNRPWAFSTIISHGGNDAITASDIEGGSYALVFETARVLTVKVGEKNPKQMKVQLEGQDRRITVRHGLLNSSDSFEIAAVMDGTVETPSIDARIRNCSVQLRQARSSEWVGLRSLLSAQAYSTVCILNCLIGVGLCVFGGYGLSQELRAPNVRNVVGDVLATRVADVRSNVDEPYSLKLRSIEDGAEDSLWALDIGGRYTIRTEVASRLYSALPVGPDQIAHAKVESIQVIHTPLLEDFSARVEDAVREAMRDRVTSGFTWLAIGILVAGLFAVMFGIDVLLNCSRKPA